LLVDKCRHGRAIIQELGLPVKAFDALIAAGAFQARRTK
jgi:hypothetical protein